MHDACGMYDVRIADAKQADTQRAADLAHAASQKALDDVAKRGASAVEAAKAVAAQSVVCADPLF
jgi:hypothetical protein